MKRADDDEFWVTWCRDELVKGHSVLLPAKGYSMWPTLRPAAQLLIVNKPFGQIAIGDLIVFQKAEQVVVHRVVRFNLAAELKTVITRGDANWHVDLPVYKENYIGFVKGQMRAGACKGIASPHKNVLFLSRLALWTYRLMLPIGSRTKQILKPALPNK